MAPITQSEAKEFYLQLERFSRKARAAYANTANPSPWGEEKYAKTNPPDGCIIHYTAGQNFEGGIKDFCDPAVKKNLSAHLLVSRKRCAWAEPMLKDCPLVASLPVTVVQCRQPQQSAIHAHWTNSRAYGIEVMNIGEVRGQRGHYVWWPKKTRDSADWTAAYPGTEEPWDLFGRLWEPWPDSQLRTVALVAAYANAYFGGSFAEHMILGHEQVQGVDTKQADGTPLRRDKRDPGPGFPLHLIRACIMARSIEDYQATDWNAAKAISEHVHAARRGLGGGFTQLDDGQVWHQFILQTHDRKALASSPRLCVSILDCLGYAVRYSDEELQVKPGSVNNKSLEVFAVMSGLPRGLGLNSDVREALVKRLYDRFGESDLPVRAMV